MLKKVISGGQTGVDRSALDVAIKLNYEYGGWCPRGRRAEDGIIDPIKYSNLEETPSDQYPQRTEFNVRDSQGTLILIYGDQNKIGRGTKLTIKMTQKYGKPLLIINLYQTDDNFNKIKALQWIREHHIEILNVAGPREETTPGIYQLTHKFLEHLFEELKTKSKNSIVLDE